MDEWMDEWMDGWMDEWIDGWMDEWVKNNTLLWTSLNIPIRVNIFCLGTPFLGTPSAYSSVFGTSGSHKCLINVVTYALHKM